MGDISISRHIEPDVLLKAASDLLYVKSRFNRGFFMSELKIFPLIPLNRTGKRGICEGFRHKGVGSNPFLGAKLYKLRLNSRFKTKEVFINCDVLKLFGREACLSLLFLNEPLCQRRLKPKLL